MSSLICIWSESIIKSMPTISLAACTRTNLVGLREQAQQNPPLNSGIPLESYIFQGRYLKSDRMLRVMVFLERSWPTSPGGAVASEGMDLAQRIAGESQSIEKTVRIQSECFQYPSDIDGNV